MAREAAPDTTGAYVGMLVLAVVSMLVGIACLGVEATEYDWSNKPAGTVPDPKSQLPKPPAVAAVEPESAPAVAADPLPEPAKPDVAAKPERKPDAAVTAKTDEAPQPLPKGATAPAAEPKPPDGPVPSPIKLRPRK